VLTARKCGHRLREFRAARRDVRRESAPAGDPDTSAADWALADPAPTPTEAALLADTLREVLDNLSERERPVVLLRLQGFGITEIAEQVGRSERTVHRVLESVRAHLERLGSAD
jgi:RNA polymerase sigma-70 factor (ECF subfamily)